MILQRLVEFDQKFGEGLPTGYQRLQVHYVLQLDNQGRLKAVVPVMEQQGKKTVGLSRPSPNLKRSGTAAEAALVVDLAKYVLGRGAEKDAKDYRPYRERYLRLVKQCADQADDRRIRVTFEFLQGLDPQDPRFKDIQSDQRLDIEIGGQRIADLPEVQQFWAKHVRENTAAKGRATRAQCLVTGVKCEPVRKFAQLVVGVPPFKEGGAELVSFNEDAFRSYGLQQTLNAPISPEASESITRALSQLLASRRHRLYIGPVAYVAWCRNEPVFDFWSLLENPHPEHIHALIQAPIQGRDMPYVLNSNFFVLALSRAKARIVVRDYHETTLENVKANLGKWFKRLQIVGTDGNTTRPVGVRQLAESLYRGENKEMPAHVPTALLSAALTGRPIPEYILGLAVKRNLAMQGPFYEIGEGASKTRELSLSRLALIKAILTTNDGHDIMTTQTDPKDRQAFACGRMLAVLDGIYTHFLNIDVPRGAKWRRPQTNVSTRYYGAACSSPASVFGRLIDNSRPHLAKLRAAGRDFGYEMRLEEIARLIGTEFPRTLDVRRQGIFALGYYHQLAEDRAARGQHGIAVDEGITKDNAE